MKVRDFDEIFDNGAFIVDDLNLSKAKKPIQKQIARM
jgi:hypothetical protein